MHYDFVVVGAGIVGLSTAYKLLKAYPDASLLILEKEDRVAAHQTGKNSGVIHSGIYYTPGSYKARNCVDGRHQLVEYCQANDVAVDVCGKVIVATDEEELPRLQMIYERGLKNEIEGIKLIDRDELLEIEPHCGGIAAIHVPCTGIVDYTGMCDKLLEDVEAMGGIIKFGQQVKGVFHRNGGLQVRTRKERFNGRYLVSCAGLYSDHVAKSAGINPPVQIIPFKGEYYMLKKDAEYLVKHLIYPLPHKDFPFLGVHFTRLALGGIECGPNAVPALKREGYNKLDFDLEETLESINYPGFWKLSFKHWRMGLDEYHRSLSKKAFVKGLQKLVPSVRAHNLVVSPTGVRAMALKPNGEILDDFHFEVDERQVHVLNAPSPAATAGLSIADEIVRKMHDNFGL